MVARLKLDSVQQQASRQARRITPRLHAARQVVVRSHHGDCAEAGLNNVSAFGCALQCDAQWLRTGLFVEIVLDDEWRTSGVLRWVRGGKAGAEFLRPISPADTNFLSDEE